MGCGTDALLAGAAPPPVIGRATPKEGRAGVMPGFLPNALTIWSAPSFPLQHRMCYREMVNKTVMLSRQDRRIRLCKAGFSH